jgi:hypothetical protein
MGRRHSKNAGVMGSEALTYHERKALGFGTVKERLGKVRKVAGGCTAACPGRWARVHAARCAARRRRCCAALAG